MIKPPYTKWINDIKTKLGFNRTMTASGADVVDAVNKQSQQIDDLQEQTGNTPLQTTAQTLSDAVNELNSVRKEFVNVFSGDAPINESDLNLTNALNASAIIQIVGYIGTNDYLNRFMITTYVFSSSTAVTFATRNGLYRVSFSRVSSTKLGFGTIFKYFDNTNVTNMHITNVQALQ